MGGVRCGRAGCRAWAMRGAAWCRAHAPDLPPLGPPPGNQRARTHGAFSRLLPRAEAEALAEAALGVGPSGPDTATDDPLAAELALCRSVIDAVLAAEDPLPPARAAAVYAGLRALVALRLAGQRLTPAQGVGLLGEAERILTNLGLGTAGADGADATAPTGAVPGAGGGLDQALAAFLLDLHALGNPGLVAKGEEVRRALQQPVPDVGHLLGLRRYFAGRARPARVAAARLFGHPAVGAVLHAGLSDER